MAYNHKIYMFSSSIRISYKPCVVFFIRGGQCLAALNVHNVHTNTTHQNETHSVLALADDIHFSIINIY